jgi:hypothetical protein
LDFLIGTELANNLANPGFLFPSTKSEEVGPLLERRANFLHFCKDGEGASGWASKIMGLREQGIPSEGGGGSFEIGQTGVAIWIRLSSAGSAKH